MLRTPEKEQILLQGFYTVREHHRKAGEVSIHTSSILCMQCGIFHRHHRVGTSGTRFRVLLTHLVLHSRFNSHLDDMGRHTDQPRWT